MIILIYDDALMGLQAPFNITTSGNAIHLELYRERAMTIWSAKNKEHAQRMFTIIKRKIQTADPASNTIIDLPTIANLTKGEDI